ncbi:MAG: DUF4062 domain-containing protein [Cyanobacteria bacterium J06597_1]
MPYRAFVSSTFKDLEHHRNHVLDALLDAGFDVDPMERWTADTDAPKQFSQDRIEGCDLCILLVAFRRGHVPVGEALSITQMEYAKAKELGCDVLVFMAKESADWPEEFDKRGSDPLLGEWRQSFSEVKGLGFFDANPESIKIAPALTRWVEKQQPKAKEAKQKTVQNFYGAVYGVAGNVEGDQVINVPPVG